MYFIIADLFSLVSTRTATNCGGHSASSCENCPMGNGPSWCNGDCEWNSFTNKCQDITGTFVSCGGHSASSCKTCPNGFGASWCHGDCEWNFLSNECQKAGIVQYFCNSFC